MLLIRFIFNENTITLILYHPKFLMFKKQLINLKRSKMENNQITIKESLYLIYSYVSISAFLLMGISKTTENLRRVLDFNPIVSLVIFLNMGLFISLYYYKKKHNAHEKQNHF
jgi:hypothetical protein